MVLLLNFKSLNHDRHEIFPTAEISMNLSFLRGKAFHGSTSQLSSPILSLWQISTRLGIFSISGVKFIAFLHSKWDFEASLRVLKNKASLKYFLKCLMYNRHLKELAAEVKKRYITCTP